MPTIGEIRRFGIRASLDHSKLDLLEVLPLDSCPLLQSLLSIREFLALLIVNIAGTNVKDLGLTSTRRNLNGVPCDLLGSL
jgi:hypothetical protein